MAATINPQATPPKPSRRPAGRDDTAPGVRIVRPGALALAGAENVVPSTAVDGSDAGAPPSMRIDDASVPGLSATPASAGEAKDGDPSTVAVAPPSESVTFDCGP